MSIIQRLKFWMAKKAIAYSLGSEVLEQAVIEGLANCPGVRERVLNDVEFSLFLNSKMVLNLTAEHAGNLARYKTVGGRHAIYVYKGVLAPHVTDIRLEVEVTR